MNAGGNNARSLRFVDLIFQSIETDPCLAGRGSSRARTALGAVP